MAVELTVLQNSDDTLLTWNVAEAIPDCIGFAVRRKLTHEGKTHTGWIDNFVGFADEEHEDGERRPSTEWPFQGFSWTDHEPGTGDVAHYQVVPVVRGSDGKLGPQDSLASDWATGRDHSPDYLPYFNRGFVMSQFMARYLAETEKTLKQFKETIGEEDDLTIRRFLSGDLRVEMLDLLKAAQKDGRELHAALYELDDDELIDALVALGPRAHVVLANGSIDRDKFDSTEEAREQDQNESGRARLLKANVDVEEGNRFISPKPLGHNKFAVFTDSDGKAKTAWTGSTNWTPTGLCTQLNNGLLIRDENVAELYLEQWHRLRDAGSSFPKELVDSNSEPKAPREDATVWFTRTRGEVDLDALKEIVEDAKQGLLFLMFQPGGTGVLKDVLERQEKGDILVRGVVSELPDASDESVVDVTFVGKEKEQHRLDVIQPEGRPHAFAWWAAEATHNQFKASVGFAIVHSKVLVVDPLSDEPVVVTGSHNFSKAASDKNDENFVVVRGDRALAEAYVVNVFSAWRHYRARVAEGNPYPGLARDDSWMAGSLSARHAEAGFWGF